jgi:prevent-host-death family protein
MTAISSKSASRRFFSVLKDAEKAPVVIELHGRPRAVVVSIRRFRLYEKLLAHISEEAALAAFGEAIEKACDGRLGLANRARKRAADLGRLATPGRTSECGA